MFKILQFPVVHRTMKQHNFNFHLWIKLQSFMYIYSQKQIKPPFKLEIIKVPQITSKIISNKRGQYIFHLGNSSTIPSIESYFIYLSSKSFHNWGNFCSGKKPIFVMIFVCDYLLGFLGRGYHIHIFNCNIIINAKLKEFVFDAKYEYQSKVSVKNKIAFGPEHSSINSIGNFFFCRC